MRVFFDGMNLALERGTGVATYTRNLVSAVKDLGYTTGLLYGLRGPIPTSAMAREIALLDAPEAFRSSNLLRAARSVVDALIDQMGITAVEIPITGMVLTRQLGSRWVSCDHVFSARRLFERAQIAFGVSNRLLEIKLPSPPDVFHWTYPIPARVAGCKNIYTLHDLVPIRLPYTTLDWKPYYIKLIQKIVETADHIVTVSEHSKRDIQSCFDVPDARITNTYQSVDVPAEVLAMTDAEVARRLAGAFALRPKEYFLFYGSIEPKKNLARVVEAFLSTSTKMPLVIVAAQSWQSEKEMRLIKEQGIKRRRIFLYEYLPWTMLALLIRGARAVLFPSLYEGFGLPVLEAMTLGTPVVSSNQSSIPEVANEAALLVDPYDTSAIAEAIARIAADDELRKTLTDLATNRIPRFSSAHYRERLRAMYEGVAAS